jgi:diacylglycerol O-acyltransferase
VAELMRNTDAFTWAMEHDPGLRSTIVTIFRLDRAPDWDALVDRFERVGLELPVFRERVVEILPPAPPRWEADPDFDLGYHLRRVTAPAPGSFDEVLEMARRAEMADFDRARPLWEVTLVDGLADGEAALLCKLHHSLTDGVGGVEIAMILFDLSRDGRERGPLPPEPTPVEPGPLSGWLDSTRYDAGLVESAARTVVRHGPRTAVALARHPLGTVRDAAATAASVYRTVRPISRTGSPLMRSRRLVRRLTVHEVPLADLKAAARRGGASLNDAFLAGVTGGLRLYHEKHGVEVGDLHVTMPVSLRTDDDPVGGNRITLMRFDLPAGVVDPEKRLHRIHERAAFVRSERSLPYTQLIAGALNLVPRWYIASILRHVDFLASDVPGIPVPVFLAGSEVLMQYSFGPTIGSAVNVTLMSYVDTCALGINVDTGAIPDVDTFHACLVAGFDEVLAVAPADRDRDERD